MDYKTLNHERGRDSTTLKPTNAMNLSQNPNGCLTWHMYLEKNIATGMERETCVMPTKEMNQESAYARRVYEHMSTVRDQSRYRPIRSMNIKDPISPIAHPFVCQTGMIAHVGPHEEHG